MARGAFRGAAGVWLGLIALQVLTTREGSGKVAGAFDAVNSLVERALDPNVAAIPDHAGVGSRPSTPAAVLLSADPAAAAAADGAPPTRLDYPTNGFPFPPLQR